MPRSRSQQVSLSDTSYYHCISRCVRRDFLCGEEAIAGKSFEHRRGWIETRILFLSQLFSIDICAYAVMSNHLHIVLHENEEQAKNWTTHEVLGRWHSLHKGTLFTQQYARGDTMPAYEIELTERSAEACLDRLTDISWFMRELNELIAQQEPYNIKWMSYAVLNWHILKKRITIKRFISGAVIWSQNIINLNLICVYI